MFLWSFRFLIQGIGSGKTLIAVLLLRHVLDQELEDRAVGKKKRIAFFLVSLLNLDLNALLMSFIGRLRNSRFPTIRGLRKQSRPKDRTLLWRHGLRSLA